MKIVTIKNKLLQSASYIFDGYLVDCGDADKIIDALDGSDLKGILLTHCHQDHAYGMEKVLQRYPEAKVYCSQKTLDGLKDSSLNLSYIMPEYEFTFNKEENVVVLSEGVHDIESLVVEVLFTEGHSEDSISYIIGNNIFTGDAHIPFAKVFTKWPTSDKGKAIESEQRILEIMRERNLNIYPGHWQ